MLARNDTPPPLKPSIPKYLQIAAYFRDQIERGDLQPGAEIDSERVIGETFGVSRPTATRAIAELRQSGLVVSRPGLGTFVSSDVATSADLPAQINQIQRAIGILQAQVTELREHVGLDEGDLVAEMAQMRERVESLVVPELEKQGALLTKMLADMRAAGIVSKVAAQTSTGDAPSAREAG